HLDRAIFFIDVRSHGKESERYFEKAKQEGIRFIRAFPHTIEPGKQGTGVRFRYVDVKGEVVVESFDMAVLSIGLEAPKDVITLARQFDIALDTNQFASTSCFEPVKSSREGVYVVGAFNSPKAIPRSVVQASAAAASIAGLLGDQRGTLTKTKLYPRERDISEEEPSVGVFVCSCGVNIAGTVDVDQVVAYAARLPHVAYVENNLFSCSADAQESITERIHEFGLNRIVIAACTPRTHEHMFQDTLKDAQLNGFMVEMANIRNQNSWVHQKDSKSATQKAKAQVRMAVAKVAHNYPLGQERIKVVQQALVVGGGLVGMTCALTIAGLGIDTVLIEKSDGLGGNALNLEACFSGEVLSPMLETLINRVNTEKSLRVYTRTTLESVSGSVGNFTGYLNCEGKTKEISFGAAVMSTGAKEAMPSEYHYGKDSRVMTQMEFDNQVLYQAEPLVEAGTKKAVKEVAGVVFIQCVGSREPQRPYCSRVCCIHSVKTAIALKQGNPEMKVSILYRDMRTYGQWEEYYKDARDLGVVFIRYDTDKKPLVKLGKDFLLVEVLDPVIQDLIKIRADYLVLASGIIAHDNKYLANLLKFTVNSDGFFNGAHPKLRPVDLPVPGLFLAGLCNYPKPMDESIEQARAVAFRVSQLLLKQEIKSEAIKAFITDKCDGCALCIDVCPFYAISLQKYHSGFRVVTDPALCQGCGICAATCPNEGIMVHGFTTEQLTAQVRAAVNRSIPRKEYSFNNSIDREFGQ
ncbi:MAG: FAD-dependent oxidoreductase, partial [Desulfobacteraceae bacterium]|nr:FAD-dependent oxidoreductase [Desulfobacteraceae bacterium]